MDKVYGHLNIYGPFPNWKTKIKGHSFKGCHFTASQWPIPRIFQHDIVPVHKDTRLVWKNLLNLTYGMNWKCTSGIFAQHQCLTSPMLLWLNWKLPTVTLQSSMERLCVIVEVIIIAKVAWNQESDIHNAHINVTIRCPHTFGHSVLI